MSAAEKIEDPTRVMPQATELEEAVLGAIMLEVSAPGKAISILKSGMFYKEGHNIIFAAIERMYAAGEPIDILTVTNHLKARKTNETTPIPGRYTTELDAVGGAYYISSLTNRVASDNNIEFHCYIIVQKWVLRQCITTCSRVVSRCYNEDPDIFGVLDEIRTLILMEDNLVKQGSEAPAVGDLINLEIEDYDARVAADRSGRLVGVSTGHVQLDRLTNGWGNGRFIILAARPAMGKTAEVLGNVVAAARAKMPVAVFSMEAPKLETVQRILCAMAEVDNYSYSRGWCNDEELHRLNAARSELATLPIYIEDATDLSITVFRQKVRRLFLKHGIKLAVADYLQLMRGSASDKRSGGNREQEISTISRGMKATAMELNVPVIALSQLSRAVEMRGGDKRPQLSDLRESGSLEQDADMVIFIHRPEVYGFIQDDDGNSNAGVAEFIIAKHRNGATGTVMARFIPQYAKFVDPEYESPITQQPSSLQPNVNFHPDRTIQPRKETEEDPY